MNLSYGLFQKQKTTEGLVLLQNLLSPQFIVFEYDSQYHYPRTVYNNILVHNSMDELVMNIIATAATWFDVNSIGAKPQYLIYLQLKIYKNKNEIIVEHPYQALGQTPVTKYVFATETITSDVYQKIESQKLELFKRFKERDPSRNYLHNFPVN